MKPWLLVATEDLIRDRWMKLRADTCELPNGNTVSPYYVIEESDWVQIFARDSQGRVLIVTQYRHPVGAVCAELPGGVIDAGEQPLEAAKRELLEETGHAACQWQEIGQFLANPARQTNTVHVFLATDLVLQAEQDLDPSEDIAFAFESEAQVRSLIKDGVFSQGLHIASFFMGIEARA